MSLILPRWALIMGAYFNRSRKDLNWIDLQPIRATDSCFRRLDILTKERRSSAQPDAICLNGRKKVGKQIIVDPLNFSEERFRPSLEERLESIISGAALMADSSCTRDDRRERIVAECNSVRQALQDLLSEYMGNVGACQILFFLLVCCFFPPSAVPNP
ncbi:Catenin alpha-1 [Anabarilius grahami]|uniref:Catenin alpha-1 n=1 Tax=Anabarilius grahami TaxID=495550 RepID=A0A3N0YX18_ANAGA|nr:Catenin alpha-1 [Anabarilius grahami]